ncbi:11370_t:CDS:1, partial [Paraglomus occultum]
MFAPPKLSELCSKILTELPPPENLITQKKNGQLPTKSPSAFIIYRSLYVKKLRSQGYRFQQRCFSAVATKAWDQESSDFKTEFRKYGHSVRCTLAGLKKKKPCNNISIRNIKKKAEEQAMC